MSKKKILWFVIIPILILFIFIGVLFTYKFYPTEYINGNVLNLAYVDEISASEGRLNSPWKSQQLYSQLMFRTLFLSNYDFTSVSDDLAKDYSISDDGLTYTITMRDDIVWSDGIALTAEDVIFSIEAIFLTTDSNSVYTTAFHNIEGVDSYLTDTSLGISGLTAQENILTITLDTPCYDLIQMLAQFVIVPKHILENEDLVYLNINDYWSNPVVSGMYQLEEYEPGEYFKLARNESYVGTAPQIDEVYLHINYSEVSLDLYSTNATMDMVNYRSMQGYSEYTVDMLFYRYFIYNIEGSDGHVNEAMQDIRVRQAIAYAIDTQSLLYDIYFNTGTLIDSGVPHLTLDNSVLAYTYNQNKAIDLLESADYDFSIPLRIAYYYTDEYSLYFIEEVAEDLEAVGFTVECFYASQGAIDLFQTREYDIALKGLAAFDISEWYIEYNSTHALFPNIIGDEGIFDDSIAQLLQATDEITYNSILYKLESIEQDYLYKMPLFTLNQYVYIFETRLSIPANVTFGNTWYRYDINFEQWKINKQ